jgi:hypothetical protein
VDTHQPDEVAGPVGGVQESHHAHRFGQLLALLVHDGDHHFLREYPEADGDQVLLRAVGKKYADHRVDEDGQREEEQGRDCEVEDVHFAVHQLEEALA